jgi:peptide/nickel transport system ATP-binding protein
LEGIPGNPLNLLEVPEGCYFQDRCNQKTEKCLLRQPDLVSLTKESTRKVACVEVVGS